MSVSPVRWAYAFIDRPYEAFGAACDFWARATACELSELRGGKGEFVTLLPSGADPCLKVQGVAEGAGGAHVDLAVEDVPGQARRARALGATGVFAEPGLEVLRSPAGHPFCFVAWQGEAAVPAATEPLNRLDQVCLDTAPGAHDAEVAFWAELTGWPELPCSGAEFRRLEASPVRLLFQRLDEDAPASAHVDLACGERSAVRAWHESLGARFVRDGRSWSVMRDPAGGLYCLTDRTP
ncbi:VOC family protein [Streptomyces sp. SID14478]|uniref:VOC family protein n=1 Tax=Streptomyces sp. SID14478 TaxID=2706073 RepID=UPI0013DB97B1|nr:VOC family protein [Streptomyces sp. SID14478]NEB73945.1 VOC family protein [Streptomyces sp. SID14478]